MMSEQLNETLLELRQTKEREARLTEENQVIFATLSALSQSQNKYQIFDELKKALSRYIRFDDFVVLSKEKLRSIFLLFFLPVPSLSIVSGVIAISFTGH